MPLTSYLIETERWSSRLTVSDGIIIFADSSLKWCEGKSEDILYNWLSRKKIEFKKFKQELL